MFHLADADQDENTVELAFQTTDSHPGFQGSILVHGRLLPRYTEVLSQFACNTAFSE